ncbi:MAG TPA: MMPL family transporter [Planctomycetota bacterium]|nr:MMPL family transporter [Planctomycetota bacterium]
MIRALVGGRRGAAVLAAFLAAGAAAAAVLPRFGIEAGTHVLLDERDPDLAYYNRSRVLWGYDEYAIVCARKADWFTPESVRLLSELAAELGRVPHVKSVTSILTVPLLRNRASPFGLPVPVLLTDPKADLEAARRELLNHTQAAGNLISADGRDVSLLAHLDIPESILALDTQWADAQARRDRARLAELEGPYRAALAELRARREAMVRGLREVAAAWGPPRLDEPVRLSGIPIININLLEHVAADLKVFGAVSLTLFLLAFAVTYRKVRWVALPILTCLLPVTFVLGAMAAAGEKVTVITSNLPVLLFVLLLPYTVYVIERYRERRGLFPREPHPDAMAAAAGDVWTPCLYSAATTMAGFASLLTSGIRPVRTFGLMMTIGMAIGLVTVLVFLPAAAAPFGASRETGPPAASGPRGVVRLLAASALRAPGLVVAAGLALLGLGLAGAARIRVETKFIDYFRPSSEVYRGLEYIDTRMGGTTPLEVVLEAPAPGFFRTPEGVEALAAAGSYFERVPEAGNVRSLKTLLDEARKALPRLTVEQLAGIKAAREQVREFVDPEFRVARVLVRFRETAPTLHRRKILEGLQAHLAAQPGLRNLEPRVTGVFLLYSNMLQTLLKSQRDTFLMVVAAIYAMLLILFRSPALAAVVLVPQVLPVVTCLGVMGWTGVPLDLVTVMIASIAMGVGIDSAIQYAVRYRAELRAAGADRREAVRRAHATVGRAIWIATSIVVAGFVLLSLSRFVPTAYFGVFTALAMVMGQGASLSLLPALFLLLRMPRS